MVSAVEIRRGCYGGNFLAAIDAGLSVRPEQRPQTMAELLRRFDMVLQVPLPLPPTQADEMLGMPTLSAPQPGRPKLLGASLLLLAPLLLLTALGAWLLAR